MRLFDSAQIITPNAVSIRPRRYRGETSKVGVFPYVIDNKVVWQFRPEDEVLAPNSVDSLLDAVMTIGHPDDDSAIGVIHGSIYDVAIDNSNLVINSDFMVVTAEADALAQNGTPLSPMYDADLIEMSGIYKGQHYDWVQKNIRYSSVGLVDRARQGDSVRVFYQLSRDSGTTVTESGIEYNASLILGSESMKVNKTKLADSVATLIAPVESPTIPDAVSATTLEQIEADAILETPTESIAPEVVAPETVTPETIEEVVEAVVEVTATEVVDDSDATVIAQITNEGGVLVNREFVNEVVAVAQTAVELGLMSLEDAIYYGQANIESIQKAVLAKSGITLRDTDDVSTAYRVFDQNFKAQKAANDAIAVALPTTETVIKQTIGDQYQATQATKTVSAPGIPIAPGNKRVPIATQQRPIVTHPATTRTTVADSADESTGLVSFDSIGF